MAKSARIYVRVRVRAKDDGSTYAIYCGVFGKFSSSCTHRHKCAICSDRVRSINTVNSDLDARVSKAVGEVWVGD